MSKQSVVSVQQSVHELKKKEYFRVMEFISTKEFLF
jgi:hypothetical protein